MGAQEFFVYFLLLAAVIIIFNSGRIIRFLAHGTEQQRLEAERQRGAELGLSQQREQYADLQATYNRVLQNFPDEEEFLENLVSDVHAFCARSHIPRPPTLIFEKLLRAAKISYREDFLVPFPDFPLPNHFWGETYQQELQRLMHKTKDPALAFATIVEAYAKTIVQFCKFLPRDIDYLLSPKEGVKVADTLLERYVSADLNAHRLFETHFYRASHYLKAHRPVLPREEFDPYATTPETREASYFGATPFCARTDGIFSVPVPVVATTAQRLEHCFVVGGSGWGKTTLLAKFFIGDYLKSDPPGMVVFDSKGEFLEAIMRLEAFDPDTGRLRDRLIVIDPRDRPHLNIFDVNIDRLKNTDPSHREQIVNGVISTYEYFFSSLLGSELTGKQSLVFRPLAYLMLSIPNATFYTMMDAMDDLNPFAQYIETLPDGVRRFFHKEFRDAEYKKTRSQVKRRLNQITVVDSFDAMFSAPRNNLDLPGALNAGKIILISPSVDFLGDLAPLFGRYFISQVMSAAYQRTSIPEYNRKPAYVLIDESSPYFDDNIDTMLATLRSYKVGITLAFQNFAKASTALQQSIKANTTLKFAGVSNVEDARLVAPEMGVKPEFILGMKKDSAEPPRWTQFAAHIKNHTTSALIAEMTIGDISRLPRMSEAQYQKLRRLNREKLTAGGWRFDPAKKPTPAAAPPQKRLAAPSKKQDDYDTKSTEKW